ncbi:MAG TPA: TldD/PmbA family protein [Chloroflexia bacterium]|nr:TldD/PmbA family protein [Chloroflexia bacterium]
MLGKETIKRITERVLGMSDADQTEVAFLGGTTALTRFANNYIHQNILETNTQVTIRVALGKKLGVATTNDLSDDALEATLARARTIANFQPENPDFKTLPTPDDAGTPRNDLFVETTASTTPDLRADGAGAVCRLAGEKGLTAAGAFSTNVQEIAAGNSLGVFSYGHSTAANLLTVVMGENSSGYASSTSRDVSDIDAEAVAREAVGKALRSKDPIDIEPGEYTVVLEEYAMGGLLEYLALSGGFSGLALQEGRSFLKPGELITGESINVYDDGSDQRALAMPVDMEGVAKRRVELIRNGVGGEAVYDSYTANREGKQSTGHALPAPNPWGPFPLHIFMDAGSTPRDELTKGIERGIWVTRFHYMGVVHPLKAIITGMTRDGTFLIENGEVTRPVKNLRFNQAVLEAWQHATLGDTIKLQKGFLFGSAAAPAARIERFNFASATSF